MFTKYFTSEDFTGICRKFTRSSKAKKADKETEIEKEKQREEGRQKADYPGKNG